MSARYRELVAAGVVPVARFDEFGNHSRLGERVFNGDDISAALGTVNNDESLTDQSFADDADINALVERFGIGEVVRAAGSVPLWTESDVSRFGDFGDAMRAVDSARESFLLMPAALRDKLDNDPRKFIEWTSNPENLDEMRKYGLAVPAPVVPSGGDAVTK